MLKTAFEQITTVLKGKFNKSGLQEKFTKHPNYLAKAKEIWAMINDDLGISDTVENKLISKVEKFEKALLSKFPELSKDKVTEIKQSVVGEFNVGIDAALKQLQDFYTKLQDENVKLKDQLNKFKLEVKEDGDKTVNDNATATIVDVKEEDIHS